MQVGGGIVPAGIRRGYHCRCALPYQTSTSRATASTSSQALTAAKGEAEAATRALQREKQAVASLSQENAALSVQVTQLQSSLKAAMALQGGQAAGERQPEGSPATKRASALRDPAQWTNVIRPVRAVFGDHVPAALRRGVCGLLFSLAVFVVLAVRAILSACCVVCAMHVGLVCTLC